MASRRGRSGAGEAPGGDGQGGVVDDAGRTRPGGRGRARGARARSRTSPGGAPTRPGDAADPPPRDPGAYSQTDHFRERLGQRGRYVSVPVVGEAIRRGQLRWNSSDGWRFALVRDGVRFVVVVGDADTPSPVVVTGWTEVADWGTAMASDRWTAGDVHTIGVRSALSADPDDRIPGDIRPHDVDRPFEIGDHRVRTDPGEGHLECVDCGGRFRSKYGLTNRRCR